MRILFLTPHYPPDVAATGQYVADLAQEVVRAGHQAVVVTTAPSYGQASAAGGGRRSLVRHEWRDGVELYVLGTPRLGRRSKWGRLLPFASYVAGAAAIAAGARVDAAYVLTDPPLLAPLLASALRRVRGIPFVYHLQDVYPDIAAALGVLRRGGLYRLMDATERVLRRQAGAAVAIGEDMRRYVLERDPALSNVEVIANWANVDAIAPVPRGQNRFVQAHGLEDRFVLMYSGNLGRAHGAHLLVDVADRLRHLPDLRLVVIGDGADRAQLVADCQQRGLDNVLFLPYQPREELSQSLSAAHASIVLQRENTLGLVVPSKLYGILAAGSAAIAAVPAQSEVARAITTHETGIVVPPGAADQIAAAAERLYRDRELCARLGCNARQAAERFFSRAAGAAQFCAVFERLAGNAAMPAAGATVDRKEDRAVARAG